MIALAIEIPSVVLGAGKFRGRIFRRSRSLFPVRRRLARREGRAVAAPVPQHEHDDPIVHRDDPDDPTRRRRLDWAALLKRTFAVDVLVCPRCRGSMHLVAFIEDARIARRILDHLGLPARPPPRPPSGQPLLPLPPASDGIDPPLILD